MIQSFDTMIPTRRRLYDALLSEVWEEWVSGNLQYKQYTLVKEYRWYCTEHILWHFAMIPYAIAQPVQTHFMSLALPNPLAGYMGLQFCSSLRVETEGRE